MARPSRTGGKMSAAQTRKASSVKGGNRGKTKGPVLAAVRSKRFTVSAKELREAREQQAATSEVLEAINRSGFDLDEILQTLVSTAARLCKTGPADIFLLEGDVYRFRAGQNLTEPYLEHERRAEIRAGLGTLVGRVALRKGVVHIVDALKDIEYEDKEAASANNFRSMLGVPLLRDGEPVGVFALARTRVEPFSESQIRLVTTFANQAVMAIENARLFNETQEALERQTATADILKVIASSPSDVQPVFNAIATNAKQLIGGFSAAVFRFVADMGYLAAFTPIDLVADEAWKASFPRPLSSFPPFEWVRGGEPAQVADAETVPAIRDLARLRGGFRSVLVTPLMNNGAPIGLVSVTRREPGGFAAHHVQLLQTFADQAVIAIENARLFNETQEALERQTATAEVLSVIASSPTDVKPVLDAIVESACKLCNANDVYLALKDGDDLVFQTQHGLIPVAWGRRPINRQWPAGRAVVDGKAVHLRDLLASEGDEFPDGRELARQDGARTVLTVPLLREGESIGVIILRRTEVLPFDDKQIALLKSFADQAVIAIENARLFNEVQARTRDLQESLQQQTATADALKVISRSAFDLDTVMNTLARSALYLCGSKTAALFLREGGMLVGRGIAAYEFVDEEFVRSNPVPLNDESHMGRAVLTGAIANIGDFENNPHTKLRKFHQLMGFKSFLAVPLMKGGRGIGVFALTRDELGPFSERQVELVQGFADQAVIAIENTRLFNETSEALARQTATADV
jgi:two-component system, NtrC family, sensor kinase